MIAKNFDIAQPLGDCVGEPVSLLSHGTGSRLQMHQLESNVGGTGVMCGEYVPVIG